LTVEQLQELELILRVPPRAQSISANLWDGKTLSHWVKEHWGVELSTRQCQRLFRQLFGVGCAERKNAAPHVHLGFAVRMCTEMAKALERSGTTGAAMTLAWMKQSGSRFKEHFPLGSVFERFKLLPEPGGSSWCSDIDPFLVPRVLRCE